MSGEKLSDVTEPVCSLGNRRNVGFDQGLGSCMPAAKPPMRAHSIRKTARTPQGNLIFIPSAGFLRIAVHPFAALPQRAAPGWDHGTRRSDGRKWLGGAGR